jgi:hypothetical protein
MVAFKNTLGLEPLEPHISAGYATFARLDIHVQQTHYLDSSTRNLFNPHQGFFSQYLGIAIRPTTTNS